MAQTDIRLGRFVINVMPVFFMILTAVMGTQFQKTTEQNDSTVELAMKVQKENSDLSRRIAATELRARDAEKRAMADTTPDKGVNVIIINPGAKPLNTLPSKSYADLNYPL